jgi:hypothetical protein
MHQARTPRAAAVAGILFGILFTCCIVLIRLATPADITDLNAWTDTTRRMVSISLALISLAGIAFLWFLGVVRDRLGAFEDQFFATVVQGSGLLFLAMTFSAFAYAAGMFAALRAEGGHVTNPDAYVVGRAVMSQMFNMYALKMASVFMISISTLWLRTGVVPRWLSYISYAVALLMLFSLSLSVWMVLWFPAWVLAVSTYFLIMSYRQDHELLPGASIVGCELSWHLFLIEAVTYNEVPLDDRRAERVNVGEPWTRSKRPSLGGAEGGDAAKYRSSVAPG